MEFLGAALALLAVISFLGTRRRAGRFAKAWACLEILGLSLLGAFPMAAIGPQPPNLESLFGAFFVTLELFGSIGALAFFLLGQLMAPNTPHYGTGLSPE